MRGYAGAIYRHTVWKLQLELLHMPAQPAHWVICDDLIGLVVVVAQQPERRGSRARLVVVRVV